MKTRFWTLLDDLVTNNFSRGNLALLIIFSIWERQILRNRNNARIGLISNFRKATDEPIITRLIIRRNFCDGPISIRSPLKISAKIEKTKKMIPRPTHPIAPHFFFIIGCSPH